MSNLSMQQGPAAQSEGSCVEGAVGGVGTAGDIMEVAGVVPNSYSAQLMPLSLFCCRISQVSERRKPDRQG